MSCSVPSCRWWGRPRPQAGERSDRTWRPGIVATVIIIALLGTAAILSTFRPATAIGLALVQFAYEQWGQSQTTFFTTNNTYINYGVALVVVWAAMIAVLKNQRIVRPYPPVAFAIWGLLGLATFTLFWNIYPEGWSGLTKRAIPYWAVFVFAMPLIIQDPRDLKIAVMTVILFGLAPLIMLFFSAEWTERGVKVRTQATDEFDARQGRTLPLVLATAAGYVSICAAFVKTTGVSKALTFARWIAVGFCLIFIFRTGSRGQLAATVGTLVLMFLLATRVRRLSEAVGYVFGLAALGIILVILYDLVSTRGGDRWTWDSMWASWEEGRLLRVKDVMAYWLDSDFMRILIGLGNSASYAPDVHGFMPEVLVVEVLAEEGVIGFVLLMTIWIMTATSALRSFRMTRDYPELRGALVAFCGLMIFEVVLSFKQGSLVRVYFMMAYPIILGRFEMLVRERLAAAGPALAQQPVPELYNMPVATQRY